MIELDGVTMRYPLPQRYREIFLHPFQRKLLTALSEVSLRIPAGASLAMLGPNGAGKTTLLKLIAGLLYPTSGNIRIDGHDTVRHNLHVRRHVGFVMNEERSFYWRLTGRQNLRFFGTLDEIEREALDERIAHLFELVGLVEAADHQVGRYSSGMRQRLALARGLLTNPDVLVLDEPTRAIDPLSANDLRRLLLPSLLRDHGKTLLIATHQLDEAELLCDRVCVVDRGRIVSCDAREAAIRRFGSLAEYLRQALQGRAAKELSGDGNEGTLTSSLEPLTESLETLPDAPMRNHCPS